jgi:flagellar basal-body rod protein FlgF
MDRLIYSGLAAMRGAVQRQNVIANNLANAQTPGFRAELVERQAIWLKGQVHDSRALASEEVLAADMTAGAVTTTGNPLDIAIAGDALLTVQAPDGTQAYTRRGDLTMTAGGLLLTGDGHPVLGGQGPITLPPADSVTIDEVGRIWVIPPGGDPAQPQQADQLQLASPAGSAIVKRLDGLFRVRDDGILPVDPDARVQSGAIEQSNVSTSEALVEMIEASRSWDTQLRLLSSARDMDAAAADLMRLPE